MSTYTLCETVIKRKTYKSKEEMMIKLDVFLLNDRISQSQYNELVKLLDVQ